jgi:hypothetical protein
MRVRIRIAASPSINEQGAQLITIYFSENSIMVSFTKEASFDLLDRSSGAIDFRDSIYSRIRPSLDITDNGRGASPETDSVVTADMDKCEIATAAAEKSRELLLRWRAGDNDARQQLIEANMDLAMEVARQKAKKFGGDKDGNYEVALCVLAKAVDGLFCCGHDNATGYLAKSMHNGVMRELKDKWTYEERYKEKDLQLVPEPVAPDENLVDVWEELLYCCETELDSKIIKLRSEGHTLQECSDRLPAPVSTVQHRLRKVERRYIERNGPSSTGRNEYFLAC